MLQTSSRVRLMAALRLRVGFIDLLASGVCPMGPTFVIVTAGELLGGTTARTGPIRRNDSVSASDKGLDLDKLSLLGDKESFEVTRVTIRVSSPLECLMIHSCFNASEAVILCSGSGRIILDMRSWAKGEIFNFDGNSSDDEHRLEWDSSLMDATQTESSSVKSASSDLKKDVEAGGVPQSITNSVTPRE